MRKRKEAQDVILLSAANLIASQGFANISMRDIAREADVSLGLLTYYFITKDNLFTALAAKLVSSIYEDLKEDLVFVGTEKEKMDNIASAFEKVLRKDKLRARVLVEFMSQSLWNKSFKKQVKKLYDATAKLIRDNVLNDDVVSGNELLKKYNSELLTKAILGALFGTQFELMLFEDISENEIDDLFNIGKDIINVCANYSTRKVEPKDEQ